MDTKHDFRLGAHIASRLAINTLATIVILVGVIKVTIPDPNSVFGRFGSVALGISEVLAGLLLWSRWRSWAMGGIVALVLAGLLWAAIGPGGACGCLGRMAALSRRGQAVLGSGIGILATLCLVANRSLHSRTKAP